MRRLVAGLLVMLLAGCGEAPPEGQAGFAGLGADAEGFRQAGPEVTLRFPGDHGAHPDYRLEWWYLTANLEDAEGEPLGIQWTLFRRAGRPPSSLGEPGPWAADQLWMAHLAVSRGASHRVAERFARGTAAPRAPEARQAGVTVRPFRSWLDDWTLASRSEAPGADALDHLAVSASAGRGDDAFGLRLALDAQGPLVRHGEAGFSRKAEGGQGSMYVSQPFYRVAGEVVLDGERVPVTGRAWLDREWSSQLLGPGQAGWDWLALHLDDGHKLMAFRLRGDDGDVLSGSWIAPDGAVISLGPEDLRLTPLATREVAGHELPLRWRLALPERGLDLEVAARHPERWMPTAVPYWEGAVTVRDRATGEPRGVGYLELTGY
ncbi:lipocalin-like domain-containing protein [Halomonas beimenensis]|uniref:AttH component of AttEFGH ABC transport system n=1 Tax=Halomonas beimenensis TaxID=475662 RepID=A0A291PCF6_9GAMM|nr:lipocalin-like domain-containing protein [Halomonas beimenensis]ATJ84529.1 AttH component of AttEFGH ABC transport system [Halomonas beimenensis]